GGCFTYRQTAPTCLTDSIFERFGYCGASQRLALVLGPFKASPDSFPNDGPLKLGKDTQHLKHRLAGRRRGVETLLVEKQIDLERVQFGQKADQVLQAAAQPIDAPGHHQIEFPARCSLAE